MIANAATRPKNVVSPGIPQTSSGRRTAICVPIRGRAVLLGRRGVAWRRLAFRGVAWRGALSCSWERCRMLNSIQIKLPARLLAGEVYGAPSAARRSRPADPPMARRTMSPPLRREQRISAPVRGEGRGKYSALTNSHINVFGERKTRFHGKRQLGYVRCCALEAVHRLVLVMCAVCCADSAVQCVQCR